MGIWSKFSINPATLRVIRTLKNLHHIAVFLFDCNILNINDNGYMMCFSFQLQFVIVIIHTSQIFYSKDCGFPFVFAFQILFYNGIFMMLFVNFYIQCYRTAKSNETKTAIGGPKNRGVNNVNCNSTENNDNHSNGKIRNGSTYLNGTSTVHHKNE